MTQATPLSGMSDLELAEEFFSRLAKKGFQVSNADYSGNGVGTPDFNPEEHRTIAVFNQGKVWAEFDFHPDGDFYRIASYTSGFWQDEVDWIKA